ncbi:MAG: hypothetical protein U0K66_08010 [Paludibacteraceae bacterium]|jgi:hypothetical protein|nr:hypothetical protein [Paludibacteraceae bacterium]
MKKVFAFVLAAMTFMSANAGNQRATGMTMVDGFKLGLGIGVPGWEDDNAVMPMITVDGAAGLASGFINTKNFGNNGGIDLGFQYGICGYDHDMWHEVPGVAGVKRDLGLMEHLILLRSAFHFQFLKKLDTYAGFHGGVALSIPTGDWTEAEKDAWDHVNGVFGMYSGGTWYFNDAIGAGIEFEGDWMKSGATPSISAKFQFRF